MVDGTAAQGRDANPWYNLGSEGGGVVAGTAHSAEACHEQALQHQPHCADALYNLGSQGNTVVAGTAYTHY